MTLDELRKLEAAATPGPWTADGPNTGIVATGTDPYHYLADCDEIRPLELSDSADADAALIAAMRRDLFALGVDLVKVRVELVVVSCS